MDQVAAVAFAFAGDALDVFGADAESDRSGFIMPWSCTTKIGNQTDVFR